MSTNLIEDFSVHVVGGATLAQVGLHSRQVVVALTPDKLDEFALQLIHASTQLREHPYWKGQDRVREVPRGFHNHSVDNFDHSYDQFMTQ